MTQFRERLVAELKLDAEQQQRLEPVFTEARNKFMGCANCRRRRVPRPALRFGRICGQGRRRAEARAEGTLRGDRGRVCRSCRRRAIHTRTPLGDGRRQAAELDVRVGLSDGAMTEVSGDGITEGLEVIVGQQGGSTTAPAQKGAPPRMFFMAARKCRPAFTRPISKSLLARPVELFAATATRKPDDADRDP